ncbi:MAG: hypothetical protein ACTSRB_14885 [Candidatus Helarchaeota archaeon]
MLSFENILAIPSFHQRLEFAIEARKAFFKFKPDVIAVEMPSTLKVRVVEAITRLPYISVVVYKEGMGKKFLYIPIEPADSLIEGIRLGIEHDIPVKFIDLDVYRYRQKAFERIEDYPIQKIGLEKFYEIMLPYMKKSNPRTKDYKRELFMAHQLKDLMKKYKRVLFILGMAHWERIKGFIKRSKPPKYKHARRKDVQIFNLAQKSHVEVLREIPHVIYRYELARKDQSQVKKFDKLEVYRNVYLDSRKKYYKDTGEQVNFSQLKGILQYSRNHALLEKELIPNMYHLIISAKNFVDDEYAAIVFDKLMEYPFQDKSRLYPDITIKRDRGMSRFKTIPLRRRIPISRARKRKIPIKRRPKEPEPGEWEKKWNRDYQGIYSYPPEDDMFENYMAFIRKKAMKLLIEDNIKVHEFKTSLMDGLELRETIRNWHVDKKIYVREEQQLKGKIGPVIVIFEEDDILDKKYDYRLTWKHEHDQESDLLIYATSPGVNIIGPGISRGEYGGFCSIFPPPPSYYYYQAWEDDYYPEMYRNKAEKLLLSAIYYAEDYKYIVYVAKKRPNPYIKSIASKRGKIIVFIPLSQFNPQSIKRLRMVHYLNSIKAREWAKNYIFD